MLNVSTFAPQTIALIPAPLCEPVACQALAKCLSAAFSSGIWRKTPMPLGSPDASGNDPSSAYGVLNSLGEHSLAVAAFAPRSDSLLGCVVGCVMDEQVIAHYRLHDYGARPGDGLLAFIGIIPDAQGLRCPPHLPPSVGPSRGNDAQDLKTQDLKTEGQKTEGQKTEGQKTEGQNINQTGKSQSLARRLFETWLFSPGLARCPRLFVRTRRRIRPIRHLSQEHRFELVGNFETDFRGQRQTRLVYRRNNQIGAGDGQGQRPAQQQTASPAPAPPSTALQSVEPRP